MLSVIMLAKDRPRLTNQAIESLMKNTTSQFTLTVVDDHSNDPQAVQLLLKWEQRYPLFHWVRNDTWMGSGWSRNRAVVESQLRFGKGSYLYLSDNDCVFLPHWDEVVIEALNRYPDVLVMGGYAHPYSQPNLLGTPFECNGRPYTVATRDAISGLSQMMLWTTWEKYGPLDSNGRGTNQSEDYAFCRKIVKAGHYVGSVVPEVVINCGRTDTFGKPSPGAHVASPLRGDYIVE